MKRDDFYVEGTKFVFGNFKETRLLPPTSRRGRNGRKERNGVTAI